MEHESPTVLSARASSQKSIKGADTTAGAMLKTLTAQTLPIPMNPCWITSALKR
ncbi:MAG: hypothetical protein ACLU2K_10820 [Clostridia bacterium]